MDETKLLTTSRTATTCRSKNEPGIPARAFGEMSVAGHAQGMAGEDAYRALMRENRRLQALVTELLIKNQRYREQHGGALLD